MLKCPDCGNRLELCIATCGRLSRKIKKNGELYKKAGGYIGKPTGQSEFLSCERCAFIYDFSSSVNIISEFDKWYNELEEAIFDCD
jgi:hypothetical protein